MSDVERGVAPGVPVSPKLSVVEGIVDGSGGDCPTSPFVSVNCAEKVLGFAAVLAIATLPGLAFDSA